MFLDNKIFTVLLANVVIVVGTPSNNACKQFEDYLNSQNNKNCYYNSDNVLKISDLILKYTGVFENYTVTTEDGYILQMFRIPRKNPKGVILMGHGMGTHSRCWVGQGNTSLAFYLWNNGYDIWLSNNCGTSFSQKHKSLLATDYRYWNFSFHECGVYDIPSQIKLITKVANVPKIVYIGHSLGATIGLVYGSAKSTEANESVHGFIFIGTACTFRYPTSILIKLTVVFRNIILKVENLRLGNAFLNLPIAQIGKFLFRRFPRLLMLTNTICGYLFGMTLDETDPEIVNYDVPVYVEPFSLKMFIHFIQLFTKETKFEMYDYGEEKNLKYYNSKTPPAYPLQNFSVPVFFISSLEDTLTTPEDTELLLQMLPKNIQKYDHYKVPYLNNIQFIWGKHRQNYHKRLLSVVENMVLVRGKKYPYR